MKSELPADSVGKVLAALRGQHQDRDLAALLVQAVEHLPVRGVLSPRSAKIC
jgi:hypothetical protein